MPALITHHLFGERSATLLPEGVITSEEELLAFLLGNQGPDPFFFRMLTTPERGSEARALAHEMHDGHMTSAFTALREGVGHLPAADAGIGRAFALGMLSHYALDRAAHPFVYAQQYAIVEAADDLYDADSEVHAVIESDLDTWMLWKLRRATVHDCPPASELVHTERICRVAGALMSQVAWETFGLKVGASEYAGAVADMELCYRSIEPHGSLRGVGLGIIERAVRSHSLLQALSHRVSTSDECAAANLDHEEWVNPFTRVASNESFPEVFDRALKGWPTLSEAFTHGGEELRAAVTGLNYSGMPLGADEAPESADAAEQGGATVEA